MAVLAVVPNPSGLVSTAASAVLRTPADDYRNMAGLQAFRTAAALASESWSWLEVHWPLNFEDALGRVERWQSPVDRARLEIV